jgi:hypothetical protein
MSLKIKYQCQADPASALEHKTATGIPLTEPLRESTWASVSYRAVAIERNLTQKHTHKNNYAAINIEKEL